MSVNNRRKNKFEAPSTTDCNLIHSWKRLKGRSRRRTPFGCSCILKCSCRCRRVTAKQSPLRFDCKQLWTESISCCYHHTAISKKRQATKQQQRWQRQQQQQQYLSIVAKEEEWHGFCFVGGNVHVHTWNMHVPLSLSRHPVDLKRKTLQPSMDEQ